MGGLLIGFSERIIKLKQEALAKCKDYFARPDEIAEINTLKILDAMRKVKVSEAHFNTTSGYAYDDIGRGKLEELYAEVFKAEAALVRTQFVSARMLWLQFCSVFCARVMSSYTSPVRRMIRCRLL